MYAPYSGHSMCPGLHFLQLQSLRSDPINTPGYHPTRPPANYISTTNFTERPGHGRTPYFLSSTPTTQHHTQSESSSTNPCYPHTNPSGANTPPAIPTQNSTHSPGEHECLQEASPEGAEAPSPEMNPARLRTRVRAQPFREQLVLQWHAAQ